MGGGQGCGYDSSAAWSTACDDAGVFVYRCGGGERGAGRSVGAGGGEEFQFDLDRWGYFDQRYGVAAGEWGERREADCTERRGASGGVGGVVRVARVAD